MPITRARGGSGAAGQIPYYGAAGQAVKPGNLVSVALQNDARGITVPLPGATYPASFFVSVGTGDQDLYTVPAGRKALICAGLSSRFTNSTGGAITATWKIKIAGSYYQIAALGTSIAPAAINTGVTIANAQAIVLAAGNSLSLNSSAPGLSVLVQIVEFDANSPLATAFTLAPASGNNPVYTVALGKTGVFLGGQYLNLSGGNRTLNIYAVPNGGATATSNQIAVAANTVTANQSFQGLLPSLLTTFGMVAGDSIVLNLDAATATQLAWATYLEQ